MLICRIHKDEIRTRFNLETVVPVVTTAAESTMGLPPKSDHPAVEFSDSLPKTESTGIESPSPDEIIRLYDNTPRYSVRQRFLPNRISH